MCKEPYLKKKKKKNASVFESNANIVLVRHLGEDYQSDTLFLRLAACGLQARLRSHSGLHPNTSSHAEVFRSGAEIELDIRQLTNPR